MKNHEFHPTSSQAFVQVNGIHILIIDIIEKAREVVVTTVMVITSMEDSGTTEVDTIRNGTFVRNVIKKIVQKRKC